jgi:S-methylmethionine-dependent homocysteine/selenocysteine methylase
MVEEFIGRFGDGAVVLIDGGTGTELEARGVPMNGAVWCGVAV